MSAVIHLIEQRTPEWYALRAGKLTGSAADIVHAQPKKGASESVQRRDLRIAMALEIVTGRPCESDGYVSTEMQRGIDLEASAFAAYEAATGELVDRVGFVEREGMAVGCSPDGVVMRGGKIVGLVSFKCPKSATHLGYIRGGVHPADYLAQSMHELFVTGADWLDFVSFDDRMPEHLQTFRVRVTPDTLPIPDHAQKVMTFLAEVEKEAAEIRALRAAA